MPKVLDKCKLLKLNTKKNNKGSVTFDYRDLDQLNRLIEIIKKYY